MVVILFAANLLKKLKIDNGNILHFLENHLGVDDDFVIDPNTDFNLYSQNIEYNCISLTVDQIHKGLEGLKVILEYLENQKKYLSSPLKDRLLSLSSFSDEEKLSVMCDVAKVMNAFHVTGYVYGSLVLENIKLVAANPSRCVILSDPTNMREVIFPKGNDLSVSPSNDRYQLAVILKEVLSTISDDRYLHVINKLVSRLEEDKRRVEAKLRNYQELYQNQVVSPLDPYTRKYHLVTWLFGSDDYMRNIALQTLEGDVGCLSTEEMCKQIDSLAWLLQHKASEKEIVGTFQNPLMMLEGKLRKLTKEEKLDVLIDASEVLERLHSIGFVYKISPEAIGVVSEKNGFKSHLECSERTIALLQPLDKNPYSEGGAPLEISDGKLSDIFDIGAVLTDDEVETNIGGLSFVSNCHAFSMILGHTYLEGFDDQDVQELSSLNRYLVSTLRKSVRVQIDLFPRLEEPLMKY